MGVGVTKACIALLPTFLVILVAAAGMVRDAITRDAITRVVLLVACRNATVGL